MMEARSLSPQGERGGCPFLRVYVRACVPIWMNRTKQNAPDVQSAGGGRLKQTPQSSRSHPCREEHLFPPIQHPIYGPTHTTHHARRRRPLTLRARTSRDARATGTTYSARRVRADRTTLFRNEVQGPFLRLSSRPWSFADASNSHGR